MDRKTATIYELADELGEGCEIIGNDMLIYKDLKVRLWRTYVFIEGEKYERMQYGDAVELLHEL